MLRSKELNTTSLSAGLPVAESARLPDGGRPATAGQEKTTLRFLPQVRRVRAFLARDFALAVSYRVDFFMRVLQTLIIVTALFCISYVFKGQQPTSGQWANPFAAWITGFALMSYFGCGFSSLANAIRAEQMQGTLENVLMTPIKIPTMIVASSAWEFVQATFFACLYLFLGWLLFGVQYKGNFLLAMLILLLTAVVLHSIGVLSASFTMVFKRGDPFGAILATGSFLLSGVLFPTHELKGTFYGISCALPTTYGVEGVRSVLLEGHGWQHVRGPVTALTLFLIGLLPFSLVVFSAALRRAKREGSLIQY